MVIPEKLYSQETKSEVSRLEQALLAHSILVLKDVAACFSEVGAVLLYVRWDGARGG